MIEKMRWIWKVLWSEAYVIATDRGAVIHMPYVDPYMISNITMLAGQRIAIESMIEELQGVVKEHEEQYILLQKEFKGDK